MNKLLFLLLLLLTLTLTQKNTCYANCKAGFCLPNNARSCTACDLGLVNLNNVCIGSSSQAAPITYLRPNSKNTITDSSSTPLNCSISNPSSSSPVQMVFSPTIGSTFTRSFPITNQHIYLQVRFNSIIAALGTVPSTPTLILNILTPTGQTIYSTVKSFNSTGNPVNCTNNYRAFDVFNVNQKFASSQNNVLVEVRSSGTSNTNIALTNFELYYGNCSQQCSKCFGPTNQECLSCRGLLTTLANNQCSNCSTGFYQNVICLPCPVQCSTCSFTNNQVKCLTCNSDIAFTSTNQIGCQTNFSKIGTATDQSFNTTDWKSSQTFGSIITECGDYSLIGGISIGVAGSTLTQIYSDLPAHTELFLYFNIFLIDQSLGDSNAYQVTVDKDIRVSNFTIGAAQGTTLTNQCGTDGLQMIQKQSFRFQHNSSSAQVKLSFLKDYAGIRDIFLIVTNQTQVSNCYSQSNGLCSACRNGLQLVNNTCVSCADGYYLQNSYCVVCPITCKTCNKTNLKINCITCQSPLTFDNGFCIDTTSSLFATDIVENVTNFKKKTNWVLYPHLQDNGIDSCNGTTILGSSEIQFKFLSMKKTFNGLPPHTGVTVFFDFYQIDDYANDQSVKFILNSNTTIYEPSNLKMNLCGNITADAIVPIYLTDTVHTGSSLDLQIRIDRMGKIGISNVRVYLLNTGNSSPPPFKVQSIPTYSVSTPPIKGLTVKLTFPDTFITTTDLNDAFTFTIKSSTSTQRLLQTITPLPLIVQNSSVNNKKELLYLLDLTHDYSNAQLQVQANPNSLYFTDANGNQNIISQQVVSSQVPRYIEMSVDNISNRSSTRNLYNLFRGCAILALFFGMASFIVGMSSAFDDFFILCQLIFVHVFLQLDYNPPSVRIPFEGLHIVQFLEWLPWPARQSIEKGIIPDNLYQQSPFVYEQYYQDIVFARTIYQTILYFAVIFLFWAIFHILLQVWNAKNPTTKYSNYFLYFYQSYDSKKLAFVDKIVRFAYFTIIWACVLQCTHLNNQPKAFNIWNSILTIVFFVGVLVYPGVVYYLLWRASNTLSANTFNKMYEDLRVSSQRLYYYPIRYYKQVAIACIIGFLHAVSPVAPIIILIVINLADALLLIFVRPLGMTQPELIQATLFYPLYPKIYFLTTVIQQILFITLQILFLVLYGQRKESSSDSYMGIGYAICVLVILLLLNGLFRLLWGFMKLSQQCYLQKQSFQQSVQKEIAENKDPIEQQPIMENAYKSQAKIERELSRLQSKKLSYVSKIRG